MEWFVFTHLLVVLSIGVAVEQLIALTTQLPDKEGKKVEDKHLKKEWALDESCSAHSNDQHTFNLCVDYKLKELRQLVQSTSSLDVKKSNPKHAIPVGFVYIQFANQSSPKELWQNMEWTELTQQYKGLFLRVEGGQSEAFGKTQSSSQSSITEINIQTLMYDSWNTSEGHTTDYKYTMIEGQWIGDGRALKYMKFLTSGAEVRPINMAIKIWIRTN